MSRDPEQIWFPAKTYGWGWGFPCRWQGWAVLLGYVALMTGGAFYFEVEAEPASYLGYVLILTGLLIGICWWKGEPPRWRWGKD